MFSRVSKALVVAPLAIAIAAASAVAEVQSHDDSPRLSINIERQGAGSALVSLGNQMGAQVTVAQSVGDRITLAPIKGEYTLREALEKMLLGSGLTYHFISPTSVVISEDGASQGRIESNANGDGSGGAQSSLEDFSEEIIVTGSLLKKDPGQLDRQLITFDRLEIEASGALSLEEFLIDLPQSFGAPTSTGGTFAGNFGSSGNFFGAAGVNLRGLSARSTLVLIDGKRTARGGVLGEIVDINTIPLSQIERVEIIFDGASSLYGADAVGGVVNLITRKSYQGANIGLVHSVPEQGGAVETQVTLGGSHSWGSGSVTANYQYLTRGDLNGDDRDEQFATSLEAGALPPGNPFNIQAGEIFDPVLGTFVTPPLFMLDANGNPVDRNDPAGVTPIFRTQLPSNTDGVLTVADFAGQEVTRGSRAEAGFGLIPGRDDHAIRISARQELTDTLLLSGSVAYSTGDTYSLESNQILDLFVQTIAEAGPAAGNPFTPFGSLISAKFEVPYLPDVERFTEKEGFSVDLSLDGEFSESWEWTLSAQRSKLSNDGLRLNGIDPLAPFCLASPNLSDCAALGLGGINMFADPFLGLGSEREVIDRLIIPSAKTINDSIEEQYEFVVRGDLFEWAGGTARTLVGVGSRTEDTFLFDETGRVTTILGTPRTDTDVAGISNRSYSESLKRKSDFIKAEINIPLFGNRNAIPGIQAFDLTFSGRYDDIDSLGGRETRTRLDSNFDTILVYEGRPRELNDTVTSWSGGFAWQVNDWLRVRASVSESFTTPPLASYVLDTTIDESDFFGIVDENGDPVDPAPRAVFISGGNPDLLPEENSSHSFGFEFTPTALPELLVSMNFHWSELTNRIGELLSPNISSVLDLNTDRLDLSIDPETGFIMQDTRVTNLGRVETNGVDMRAFYQFFTAAGEFDITLDYAYLNKSDWFIVDDCGEGNINCFDSYLDDGVSRVGRSERVIGDDGRLINAPFEAIPRHRANLRLGWEKNGWRVDLTKSYQSKAITEVVRSDANFNLFEGESIIRAANPIDLVVRYDFDKAESNNWFFKGTRISLNVINVANDNAKFTLTPKFDTDTAGIFNANASRPRGRAFNLSIDKRLDL